MMIELLLFCTTLFAPQEKTMLCLGDSYTIGQSVQTHERFPELTVELLAQHNLNFANPDIIARTGFTSQELITNIEKNTPQHTYDIVTLLIGVNDQFRGYDTTTYAKNFETLLKTAIQFANNNAQHVFVLSIPDYGVTPFAANLQSSSEQIADEINAFNSINQKIANKYNVQYLNITEISRLAKNDNTLLANDGLHPSGKMYGLWAEKLTEQISSSLGKNKTK
ncbi:MAG TPA: SGNH/GDSL hydrolase family protein [Chitinophagales bacterium]|nr:SGNH/GDSL hydrolase family protein [Chitinophagales bacterium]